jgi:putative SOS response-associated peptidase YedK
MCGRFTLHHTEAALVDFFELTGETTALIPRYNIAPTQPVAVVRTEAEERNLTAVLWGLIPSWAKDQKIASRLINARSETVAEKPSFRSAYKYRRCLVPTSGYYVME